MRLALLEAARELGAQSPGRQMLPLFKSTEERRRFQSVVRRELPDHVVTRQDGLEMGERVEACPACMRGEEGHEHAWPFKGYVTRVDRDDSGCPCVECRKLQRITKPRKNQVAPCSGGPTSYDLCNHPPEYKLSPSRRWEREAPAPAPPPAPADAAAAAAGADADADAPAVAAADAGAPAVAALAAEQMYTGVSRKCFRSRDPEHQNNGHSVALDAAWLLGMLQDRVNPNPRLDAWVARDSDGRCVLQPRARRGLRRGGEMGGGRGAPRLEARQVETPEAGRWAWVLGS